MFKNLGQEVDMDEAMVILDPMTTGYVTFAALASYVGNWDILGQQISQIKRF